ncbi:unnamed protein product [Closterium sp. NIES-54]
MRRLRAAVVGEERQVISCVVETSLSSIYLDNGAAGAGGTGGTAGGTASAGAGGTGGTGGARAGGTRGTGGAEAAGPGDAHTRGAGAAGAGAAAGAGGIGASGTGGTGGAGAGGTGGTGGARAASPGSARTRGARAARAGGAADAGGAGGATRGAGAGGTRGAGAANSTGTTPSQPFFYPQPQSSLLPPDSALRKVLSPPSSTDLTPPLLCPPTDQSQPQLLPGSLLPAPAPHTEVTESLTERHEPETRASTPIHARPVARPRPPALPGTHGMALRPSSIPQRVVLLEPLASSLLHVPDLESDLARATSPTVTRLLATIVTDLDFEPTAAFALVTELVDSAARSRLDYVASLVTESESVCPPSVGGEPALSSDVFEDTQFELECLAVALPHFTSMLLFPERDPDALDIPTPRSYAEAITGEYSSQWQTAMDAEMASWKSTGTYVNEVNPPGANIGVDFFQTFSPTPKMTPLRVLLHVASQRNYELHSLNFSTAFLQGSLHEEIWLRRPPGFTGSFPTSTQWSLRQPVYGLRQAPCEWHDTLRTTLVALGFAPSADPSLFQRTDTSLPPFFVLVHVDKLVFATVDNDALALVKAELQERHTRTDLGPSTLQIPVLHATTHSSAYWPLALNSTFGPINKPNSQYPELVGCLICEAGIYAGAMAAQELSWLTYLLSDLGERPRSPQVLL